MDQDTTITLPNQHEAKGSLAYDTPPGKELNALVAEFVMQWETTDNPDDFTDHDRPLFWVSPNHTLLGQAYRVSAAPEATPFNRSWKRFDPSSDGNDMLMVLHQMQMRGFRYQILKSPRQCHMVAFESRGGDVDESAFYDCMAEAISRAALLATMPKQENKDYAA